MTPDELAADSWKHSSRPSLGGCTGSYRKFKDMTDTEIMSGTWYFSRLRVKKLGKDERRWFQTINSFMYENGGKLSNYPALQRRMGLSDARLAGALRRLAAKFYIGRLQPERIGE